MFDSRKGNCDKYFGKVGVLDYAIVSKKNIWHFLLPDTKLCEFEKYLK